MRTQTLHDKEVLIDTLSGELTAANSELASLQGQMNRLEEKEAALEKAMSDLAAANSELASMQCQVNRLEEKEVALEKAMIDLTAANSELAGLKGQVRSLEHDLDAAQRSGQEQEDLLRRDIQQIKAHHVEEMRQVIMVA
jgi:chromosome segregation ATPase